MLKRTITLAVVILAAAVSHASAQQTSANANTADAGRNKYQHAEVAAFTAQEGVEAPAELLQSLSTSAVQELQKIKKFTQVTAEGAPAAATTATASPAAAADGPTMRIVGVVTKYKAGSRAKRYFVGFGAGKTKVDVLVKFVDKATGEVLHEQNVDGDVVMGLFGGDSGGATREVGKNVAKAVKKRFF